MAIARVFPRRTAMTPTDKLAWSLKRDKRGIPIWESALFPGLAAPEVDEVHVSVAFTWDVENAEKLAESWRAAGVPVKIGGPAFNQPGGTFVPGMYTKRGVVITSRGCPNHCWFCSVPGREGGLRELPITDGWNIIDDNLLACSEWHIRAVFEMLGRQRERAVFTGGLEARILKPWHVELMRSLKPAPRRMYFAYDTPDDYEPLVQAGKLLRDGGFSAASHIAHCYVLIGYKGDTFERAEKRLRDTIRAGFVPYAMLYRDGSGETEKPWRDFQRVWLRPNIVMAQIARLGGMEIDQPALAEA